MHHLPRLYYDIPSFGHTVGQGTMPRRPLRWTYDDQRTNGDVGPKDHLKCRYPVLHSAAPARVTGQTRNSSPAPPSRRVHSNCHAETKPQDLKLMPSTAPPQVPSSDHYTRNCPNRVTRKKYQDPTASTCVVICTDQQTWKFDPCCPVGHLRPRRLMGLMSTASETLITPSSPGPTLPSRLPTPSRLDRKTTSEFVRTRPERHRVLIAADTYFQLSQKLGTKHTGQDLSLSSPQAEISDPRCRRFPSSELEPTVEEKRSGSYHRDMSIANSTHGIHFRAFSSPPRTSSEVNLRVHR